MSFTSDITIGAVPLRVSFQDTTPIHATHGAVVGWSWAFGDGEVSTEQNPVYTYTESGRYDATLIVTYADTSTETFLYSDYIIADLAKLEADTKCLRFATEQSEGYGWSEYAGTNNVEPFDNYGAIQVIDDNGNSRDLVFDKNDFKVYENDTCDKILNTVPSHLDKNTSEILWEKWEKETVFDQTEEHKEIKHEATHIYIRPQDDENRGVSGYTSSGQRVSQEISVEAYVNGEKLSYSGIAEKIQEDGEVYFQGLAVKNNRIQIVTKGTASEVRIIGHSHEFLGVVGTPVIPKRKQTEYDLYIELMTDLILHIVRYWQPGLNRISGSVIAGFTKITGPDGEPSGVTNVSAVTLNNRAHNGEFTVIIWSKSVPTFSYITLSQYSMVDKYGWYMFYARSLSVNVPANTWELQPGNYYDVRFYKKYISDDALEILFNDITKFNGIKTIPII